MVSPVSFVVCVSKVHLLLKTRHNLEHRRRTVIIVLFGNVLCLEHIFTIFKQLIWFFQPIFFGKFCNFWYFSKHQAGHPKGMDFSVTFNFIYLSKFFYNWENYFKFLSFHCHPQQSHGHWLLHVSTKASVRDFLIC